ncbi:sulfate transporter [Paenibacillus yonginensis]|uniref:Sulfate transporter n=2 Tax=Paenibacillus TaxID=44249 RepID=A0A1B1MWD9_9BACL|nr:MULTISPECIES: sulfate permease [Paenibacillus]ANS73457.1 sulfate transporter [Paenibacillus yonginensis]GGA28063.1 sodium-independent anion transporter [Paenibacillus physcomitrellae]
MKWSGRYQHYTGEAFRRDLIAGGIVGIVAIPLGMAFAIASGVKPEYGLYTTIVAGILISLFGGSKFQIGGPTGAFIPVLLGIVMQYGYQDLLIAGFMGGVILLLMGVLRLGFLIRYIPKPVTIGFTAGIAVTIFSGQIGNFLGLTGVKRHEYFLGSMRELWDRLPTWNLYSVLTAAICLAALLITPKLLPKLPASMVGLLLSTAAALWLYPGQVATIGSAYGTIPGGLPVIHGLDLSASHLLRLLEPALIIAMLGSIESLLSAVVADGMSGTRHNSNRELLGQGIANIVTPFFGGIPATGAIARTATNIRSAAASPLSGIVHGIVVLLIVALFAPYASNIPLASMAPVLMMVAWNMSERKAFVKMLKTRTGDSVILLVTFFLTVFTTLTTAVEAGLLLAAVLFIWGMSRSLVMHKALPDAAHGERKMQALQPDRHHDCPQIAIFSVNGALFFGAATAFEEEGSELAKHPLGCVILRMSRVPFMDTTGEAQFTELVRKLQDKGTTVLVAGLNRQPKEMLTKTGGYARLGDRHCFEHTGEALDFALSRVDRPTCKGCRQFAFRECASLCKAEGETAGFAVPGSAGPSVQKPGTI